MTDIALVWIRRDLRIHDHPPLVAALAEHERVVPVFCLDPRLVGGRFPSPARTWFLLESVKELGAAIRARGGKLALRVGAPREELPKLCREVGARAVYLASDVSPYARGRDGAVRAALREIDVEPVHTPGNFVADVSQAATKAGTPFAGEVEERAAHAGPGKGVAAFRRQLAWRDFYAHVLLNNPGNASGPHNERYAKLEWDRAPERLAAWKEGRTGYPLIDAGMRQLTGIGWMHNRARLVVGAFLTKDLHIDWRGSGPGGGPCPRDQRANRSGCGGGRRLRHALRDELARKRRERTNCPVAHGEPKPRPNPLSFPAQARPKAQRRHEDDARMTQTRVEATP